MYSPLSSLPFDLRGQHEDGNFCERFLHRGVASRKVLSVASSYVLLAHTLSAWLGRIPAVAAP